MRTGQRSSGGEQAGRLLIAAGAFTLVNNYLPGAEFLNVAVLNLVGGVALALGVGSLFVPWDRLPLRAPLVLALVAFALIALSNQYGGVSAFSYAVYFVVVFVWVGLAQPPRTSYWLAPFAITAYVLPFLGREDAPTNAVASVTVAIPVCILVGEVLARSVRRFESSREQLRDRVEVVEQLATLTTELGRDLDSGTVSRRMVDIGMSIFGGTAAVFGEVRDGQAVITAVAGLPEDLIGQRFPLSQTRLMLAAASDRLVATTSDDVALLPCPPGGSALTVACCAPELIGGLTVLLARPPESVTAADHDVLRLLGAQGTAALVNAVTHAEVVRQREHEQAVSAVLTDGVLVLSRSGQVVSCNAAAAALLGRPVAEVMGGPAPVVVALPGVPLEQEVWPGRWVEVTAAALKETGELVVALHDTSRQRALDEAKDLFLATTSHELRTPLTAIKGYISLLLRRWDDLGDGARRDALAVVDRQTDALVELTEHLLMGARAGAQAHTAPAEPYDLGGVVRGAALTYARLSDKHKVLVDVGTDLPLALGQRRSTENVLGQLIENAIKYSPGGGDVVLAARAEDGALVVEVSDRGVGVPPGREAALFTPFYQGGAANTREFGGVGLGLYIVRQLVQAQGGTVTAANRDGGGTVFRFTVPMAPAASTEPTEVVERTA